MSASRKTGDFLTISTVGERVRAFIPRPLPPDPPLNLTLKDISLLEKANLALGRIDGLATLLPDVSLFIYMYVRKEAVLSSQIEGTQSSLSDLLQYESEVVPGVPDADVVDVSLYVRALEHGLNRMQGGFPLSLRLLREVHGILLSQGRGSSLEPGEFRRSQNWLGGTRPGNAKFVPPPPERVMECLSALEGFLHEEPERMPVLLKAALAHVQFETIHPFLDGNGRMGRLLIALLLTSSGALSKPILYLSLFFKQYREEYYRRLDAVRTRGDWEGWIRFFLEGVRDTSEQVVSTAQGMLELFSADEARIRSLERRASSASRVHHLLQRKPFLRIPAAVESLGLSTPTVTTALKELERLGIVQEITQRNRDRVFAYKQYILLLEQKTMPH